MKGWDPEGQHGPRKPLPDAVQILEPPVEKVVTEPVSDHRDQPATIAPPVEEQQAHQEAPGFDQPPQDYQEQSAF